MAAVSSLQLTSGFTSEHRMLYPVLVYISGLDANCCKLNLPRPKAGCDLQSEPALPACVQICTKMRIRKRASVVLQLFDERYYILHASAGNQNCMHVAFFETPAKSAYNPTKLDYSIYVDHRYTCSHNIFDDHTYKFGWLRASC